MDFDESQDVPEETSEAGDTAENKEEEKKQTTVYYVTDEIQQSQYINMFKDAGLNAVILRHNIDTAFITHVERQREDVKFQRIDADCNGYLQRGNLRRRSEGNHRRPDGSIPQSPKQRQTSGEGGKTEKRKRILSDDPL